MIQDIFPKKLNNHFDPEITPTPADTVLIFQQSKVLVRKNDKQEIEFPSVQNAGTKIKYTFLFSIDEEKFFLGEGQVEIPDFDFTEIRELRNNNSGPLYKIMTAYTGKHLDDWYRDTKFCGRCGNKMEHSKKERAMLCPHCNNTVYPRIMPAVIVGIINNDKILLTKYKTGYAHYALVAGFTEIGETAEETVSREVMEETGLKVKNIKYYKSQPWGIANDLLLGFYCQVDGDTAIHMDENELKFAEWIQREEIQLQPDSFSLTNEMMKNFKDGNNIWD